MRKRNMALFLVIGLTIGLSACGSTKKSETESVKSTIVLDQQENHEESDDPVVKKAMEDYRIIEEYGMSNEGQSNLSFYIKEGSMQDCGDYYKLDVTFAKGIAVDAHLKIGDEITFVTNELTGETDTVIYKEKGILYSEKTEMEYWYSPTEDEDTTVLFCFSDDRVEAPFYEGTLLVRKDAQCGEAITQTYQNVTMDNLFGYYNGVRFDKDGYVTALIFFGD